MKKIIHAVLILVMVPVTAYQVNSFIEVYYEIASIPSEPLWNSPSLGEEFKWFIYTIYTIFGLFVNGLLLLVNYYVIKSFFWTKSE